MLIDADTFVSLISFSLDVNSGFTTVLSTNTSELYGFFNMSPYATCNISLIYPRCGGTRHVFSKFGEILVSSEISASHYLVYAKSQDFSEDYVNVYALGNKNPIVSLQGNGKGVWIIYCLNGRQGINSLKVIDLYVDEKDFKDYFGICNSFYGNQTWTDEEIAKGTVFVID